jgi:hypothetical protein
MSDEVKEIRQYLDALSEEIAKYPDLLARVEEDQWFAPPRDRGEADMRVTKTGHSDPTGDVASDTVRLSVRDQVQVVHRTLRHALIQVRGVRNGLEGRYEGWMKNRVQKGKTPPDPDLLS